MIGKEILNYTITSFIGKGGMGSVYLAEHKYIKQQKVAIKVINAAMVNDFTRSLLQQEAEHLAKLNHPNIVHFLDYHIDQEGNVYLIEEYADGVSLDKFINQVNGLIVENRICAIFEPILDAVGYAHKNNIIHRDIKPNNIILTPDGTPKILDFGIATLMGGQKDNDMIMGTPSYMSPEQVKNEPLDERSDIYSLGVMLYQMLTGVAPYDTTSMSEFEINRHVVEEPLPRMKSYYKYISDKVQRVVDKATEKDKNQRYAHCSDFKKALHDAIYPPKMPAWTKIAAAVLTLIVIAGSVGVWDYNRIKVKYYKDYVEQYGIPQGIGKLTEEVKSHRNRSYRFEYQRGKLIRMSHINAYDKVIEDGESERYDRPIVAEYSYDDKGKLARVRCKNQSGKVLYVMSYNENGNTVIFQEDDQFGTEKTLTAQTVGYVHTLTDVGADKGRISRYLYTYDEKGYVKTLQYAGFQNVLVSDANHIYGIAYTRDEKGRVVELQYLNKEGNITSTNWGLAIKQFVYDEEDNWVQANYLQKDYSPSLDDPEGVAVYKLEYDQYGNHTKAMNCSNDGKLMIPKRFNGIASMLYTYDDHGCEVRFECYGADSLPTFNTNGWSIRESEYDQNGFLSEIRYYDADHTPCVFNEGYAKVKVVMDESGNALESWYYNLQDSLVETHLGYAGIVSQYDSIGNCVLYRYYDANRQPVMLPGYDYSIIRNKFNNKGQLVAVGYYDTNDQPCYSDEHIQRVLYEYNLQGNETKRTFIKGISAEDWDNGNDDINTELVLGNAGIAGLEFVYNDNGLCIASSKFGTKHEPVNSDGYCYCEKEFDEFGNMLSVFYYDAKHNLATNTEEYVAGNRYKYDAQGRCTERQPINTSGKNHESLLCARMKYDEIGNIIDFSLFDEKGNPALNNRNYHRYTARYDAAGNQIECIYYDKKGNRTNYANEPYAIERATYDQLRNCTRRAYFDKQNRPVCCREHWASSTYEYDVFGNITRQCFFDTNGQPTDKKKMVPEGFCKYDKRGNRIYLASADGHGNIIINPQQGVAIIRYEYDNHNNNIRTTYFDEKDRPMVGLHKYHEEVCTYDDMNRLTTVAYFDTKHKPTTGTFWYHKLEYSYTDNDKHASTCKIYNTTNQLIDTQVYKDGQWHSTSTTNRQQQTNNNSSNWKQSVSEFQKLLPYQFENSDIILQSMDYTSTSLHVVYKLNKSKYEVSPETMKNYLDKLPQTNQALRELLSMPASIRLTYDFVDSKGRSLK